MKVSEITDSEVANNLLQSGAITMLDFLNFKTEKVSKEELFDIVRENQKKQEKLKLKDLEMRQELERKLWLPSFNS